MIVAVATTVQRLLIGAASHACPPFGYPSRNVIMAVFTPWAHERAGHRPGQRRRTAGHRGPPQGAIARPAGTAPSGAPSPPACRPGPRRPARSPGELTRTGGDSSV